MSSITNFVVNSPIYKSPLAFGNIIPGGWYHRILNKNGKPDLNAITILSEIFYWYRPKSLINPDNGEQILVNKFPGELWQTSYRHFEEKFTYNHQRIRRALVRLEQLGIIERVITNIKLKGQKYTNVLFIKLNIAALNKIVSAKFQLIDLKNKPQKDSVELELPQGSDVSKNVAPSLQNCSDHMNSNTTQQDFKSRSNESNFDENNFKKEEGGNILVTNKSTAANSTIVDKVKAKITSIARKSIAELAPITEDEADNLRASSKREFSLHYINKLKVKLGDKYPQHGFYSRAKFLEYLSDALAKELRQESTVNNESFQFKKDADTSRIDNYLRTIEDSKDTDRITQLKKKIAAKFDSQLSYKFLTICRFKKEIADTNNFEIQLLGNLTLNKQETNILLEEVRAVFGNHINDLQFNYQLNPKTTLQTSDGDKLPINLGKEGTVWHKVSTQLLELFGEDLHRSWFSKLKALEDENFGSLILKAPSEFIKNWIETNYLSRIQNSFNLFNTTSKYSKVNIQILVN